jgi:hypothetical protein
MAPPKKITLDDTDAPEGVVAAAEAEAPAPDSPEAINARIAAELGKRVKSRAFSSAVTIGKAGLFDVRNYANGIDYTVGGLLEARWCNADEMNIANKRMKGFMFPEEAHPNLRNISQNGLVLMVRTKQAADEHRKALRELTANLDGQAFDKSAVVEQGNSLRPNVGKVFREFEKIQAG